jgi:regulator of extracellular matrix RemA (YlzA/DUF370 family)
LSKCRTNMLVDATQGRRTRSIITDSDNSVLSVVQGAVFTKRFGGGDAA